MYEGHSDRVLAVSINEKIPGHDDTIQYVVAGSRDETVCVWNYKTRVCVQVLSGHDGAVWAVAVYVSLNAPPLAFSGSSDCSIRSWNIITGEVLHIFKGHSDTVLALSVYNGGQYSLSNECRVISGGADHMVRVWDMSTGRHTRMLEGHTDDVNTVCIVEDTFGRLFRGVKIVSGGRDRTIRVWDLQRGAQIAEFSGHADCVYGVCGIVGKFATMQAAPAKNPRPPANMPQASSTRSTIAAGHMNRSSSVWVKAPADNQPSDAIPDSFVIASCSEDRTIKLWNVMEERLLITSKLHKGSVKGISMSPIIVDQSSPAAILLTSCSWDKSVLYYDVDTLLAGEEKSSCCCLS
jgi:WD40 repeat protein